MFLLCAGFCTVELFGVNKVFYLFDLFRSAQFDLDCSICINLISGLCLFTPKSKRTDCELIL